MERVLVIAGAIIVLGGAIVVLAKAGTWVGRIVGRMQVFLDDWAGEPARPGTLRRPGVPERLGVIETRLQTLEKEMRPNAGSTLRDAVDRMESTIGTGGAP